MGSDVDVRAMAASALAKVRRRPVPPTHREFLRTMVYPSGPRRGQHCDPDSDPVQSWLISQMDAGFWKRIYWCASPQVSGKTQIAVMLPVCRYAVGARLPVGYGLPTLKDLDKAFQTKLRPGLLQGGYASHFPEKGPGSRGGRPHVLPFVDPKNGTELGSINFCAGGAYGDTTAAMIVDEIDQFRTAAGEPLWKDLDDLWSRCNVYDADPSVQVLRIGTGTVETDDESIILECVDEHGTGTRWWPKCPYCGRHQVLAWDQVKYDDKDIDTAQDTARVHCRHCGVAWSHADRVRAIFDGRPVHKGQEID